MFSECARLLAKSYGSFTTSLNVLRTVSACMIVLRHIYNVANLMQFINVDKPIAQYRMRSAILIYHLNKLLRLISLVHWTSKIPRETGPIVGFFKWSYDPRSYERNFCNCVKKPAKFRLKNVGFFLPCDVLSSSRFQPVSRVFLQVHGFSSLNKIDSQLMISGLAAVLLRTLLGKPLMWLHVSW